MTSSFTDRLDPTHEAGRLAVLARHQILDTPADGAFDIITALAADIFKTPISIISLVDHDRIWFKSHHGLDVQQIDRGPGLCASAILQDQPWVLTDALTDPRSLTNPMVAGEFGLRFYVGIPLKTREGYNLGTLCVIDREPRTVTTEQIAQLERLATVVVNHMEVRMSARQAVAELSEVVAQKDSALEKAELLSREIDHRVMNSLQLVAGLLTMQSRSTGNSEAIEHLSLAASRISAIARVHQHIFLSNSVDTTDCKSYIEKLCEDLSGAIAAHSKARIVVHATTAALPNSVIIPLGLILNELVTNAAKHGAGDITVTFDRSPAGGYFLAVANQGAAVPDTFDPKTSKGFGMKVVTALVEQLGGKLVIGGADNDRNPTFTILFGGN